MLTEKRKIVAALASPRVSLIALGAGGILAMLGLGAHALVGPLQPSPSPSPTPTASASPSTEPSPSASPTPSPTPSPTATPQSVSAAEARAAYANKDYAKAVTLFNQVILTAPAADVPQLRYELGNAYRENNEATKAIAAYTAATDASPTLVVAWQARANILIGQNNREAAKTVLEAAIAANPDNQDLRRDLSVLQLNGPAE